jgi:hypothetical protein
VPVTVPDRFHNVTLAGNTAGVLTEVVSGTLSLAGGNNITLSQAGNAITISGAAAGGAQTAISGLANSETTYTSGSVTLSALANITIRSTTGQQFQFSVAAQTSQSNTLGMSNIGNTAGDTAIRSGPGLQIVLAGGNNITLSQSTAGSSATITISAANETQTVPPIATTVQSVATANSVGTVTRFAPEDHRHVGIAQAQISGNTSNTSNVVLGSLVLAGGNNVTLSQVSAAGGATITISAANETQTVPPIATTVQSVATANSVGTVTRFAPEDHRHVGVAQAQISGNTSNTSNVIQGSLVLAGGNNITLSQVSAAGGATITISGPNVGGAQTGISGLANSQTTYTSGSVTFSELGAITIRSTTGQQFQFSVNAQTVESNTIGMSNIGNTSGDTAIRSAAQLQIVFAGGNNVTLSQSTNGSSATITVSAFNQTVESNTIGMSNIGNTAGDTAIRSAAQLRIVLAGGNNITLSQSTNGSSATVTISAFNQTSPVVGNAIQSVSSATDSGAATSKFAADDHKHAGVGPFGVSNIGGTSGDTGTQYGRVVLAGGNNITLSVSSSNNGAQTVTISAAAGGGAGYTAGLSNIGNTSGDTVTVTGRLILAGGNNITLSGSSNAGSLTVTISSPNLPAIATTVNSVSSANSVGTVTRYAPEDHQHAGVGPEGVSNIGNTAGNTTVMHGRVVWAGGNGVTLSVSSSNNNAQTITVSAGVGTIDYWNNFQFVSWGTSQVGQSTLFMTQLPLAAALQFDRALHYITMSQSTSSNSSYSIAVEFHAGIYTKNASTLSLLKSGSGNNVWSMTSNNTTADQAGIRMITAAIQTTLTAGNYWLAFLSVTKSTNANWASISNQIIQAGNSVFSGPIAVASNSSFQPLLGVGIFSAQTAALPNSIAFSQIYGASAAHFRSQPMIALANGTMP